MSVLAMHLLPRDTFTLELDVEPEVVLKRLATFVDVHPRWWQSLEKRNPYVGTLDEDAFKIHPVLGYTNAFAPVVCGKIHRSKLGASIAVVQRLNYGIVCLFTPWLGFLALVAADLIIGLFTESAAPGAVAMPLVMLAVLLAAMWGGFWFEARHVRMHLTGVLTGTQSKPRPMKQSPNANLSHDGS